VTGLLFENWRTFSGIEKRDTFGCRKAEFVLVRSVEKLGAPFSFAKNVRIPDASVNEHGVLPNPYGGIVQTNLVTSTLSDKRLILPFINSLFLEVPLQIITSAKVLRRFSIEKLMGAKNADGRGFPPIVPLQVRFFDGGLILRGKVRNDPCATPGNLCFDTFEHQFALFRSSATIPSNRNESDKIDKEYSPLWSSVELILAFPFFWWGGGWWKGLYKSPYGRWGYILATGAVLCSVILILTAVRGFVEWSMRF
jgi:hypothetical protein